MPLRDINEPDLASYLVDLRRRLIIELSTHAELRDVDIAKLLGVNKSTVSRVLKAKARQDSVSLVTKKIRK